DGTLSSSLPIAGNIHTIANADLATVTITNVLPNADTNTDPIDGVRVWEGTFTVGQRSVEFTRFALRQINSIDSTDVSNFKLLIDGVEVATVDSLDSNGYITFSFNKTMQTGARNVKVLADITGGSSRAIQMSLRNRADVEVKDAEYNVTVLPTVTGSATANKITVNSGVMSVIVNNAALPVTVANNSSGVLLGQWKVKATGEPIKVETLKAGFTYNSKDGSNANAELRNGKIMINGIQAGSTANLKENGTEYTVNYTFQPGIETIVEVYADIYDNDGSGEIKASDIIKTKLIQGVDNATRQVSMGTMDVPGATSEASTIVVGSGSATLTKATNYGDQNTVIPQTAYKIGSWNLTAGTAEDINVSGLSFVVTQVVATFTHENMTDMYATYQVGNGPVVTTSVTPTPTATNTYSISFVLPKGQTAAINLYSNLLSTATGSVKTTLTVTGTGAQSGTAVSINDEGVGATDGQTIAVAAGSFTVSKDASSPVASLVTEGSTVKVASYKLEALNDSYTVSRLKFNMTGTSALKTVQLKEGSNVIGSQAGAPSVTFNFATPITIPANQSKVIDVEVVLGTIGAGTGDTGADISAELVEVLRRDNATGTAEVVAVTPGAGEIQYAYKGIPTISLETLPSTVLTAGTKTLQKFQVSASTNPISWAQIIFSITRSSGPTISDCNGSACTGIKLYREGGIEVPGTMIASGDLTSAAANTITVKFIPNNPEQISTDSPRKYELVATNIGGIVTSGQYINTSIPRPTTSFAASAKAFAHGTNATTLAYAVNGDTNKVAAGDVRKQATVKIAAARSGVTLTVTDSGYALGSVVGANDSDVDLALTQGVARASGLIWSDISKPGSSISTTDWATDYLVRNLPTSTQTLSGSGS
ncbi:MAG: hypothetical protein XD85_0408, partial [Parcubacteria bacterium 34_609]